MLRIPDDFAEAWRDGRPAPVEIIADRSLRYSGTTISRVNRYLSSYNQQIGNLRLQLRGVHPDITRPIDSQVVDLSTPTSRGGQILAFLPYFILITVFMGSMHMAIDTTAGERERKSLEPLLINPLPRWQIMAGKLGATTFFALATLALGPDRVRLRDGLSAHRVDGHQAEPRFPGRRQGLPGRRAGGAAGRGDADHPGLVRQELSRGPELHGLVIILPMAPSLWLLINPAKAEFWMTLVPLLNQNILIVELVRGESIPLSWFGATIGSTLALALLLAAIAGSLYNRPKLIFTSD